MTDTPEIADDPFRDPLKNRFRQETPRETSASRTEHEFIPLLKPLRRHSDNDSVPNYTSTGFPPYRNETPCVESFLSGTQQVCPEHPGRPFPVFPHQRRFQPNQHTLSRLKSQRRRRNPVFPCGRICRFATVSGRRDYVSDCSPAVGSGLVSPPNAMSPLSDFLSRCCRDR